MKTEDLTYQQPQGPEIGKWVNVEDSTPERYELVLGVFSFTAHDGREVNWVRTVFFDDQDRWNEISAFGPASVFMGPDPEELKEEVDPKETVCVSNRCDYGDPVLWARFRYMNDGDIQTTLIDTTKGPKE